MVKCTDCNVELNKENYAIRGHLKGELIRYCTDCLLKHPECHGLRRMVVKPLSGM